MDELGFNKIAAAVLVTGLGFMGLKEISHSAMHVSVPETPAYALEIETAPTDGEVIELPFPQAEWIAAMDVDRGAKVFKKCTSCHNAEDGGANGTGPNLWDIVGHSAGGKDGFKYSSAMAQSGLTWDYETLDGFLTKPTKYLSGTAMNFVGLKKEGDRAAVIAYLRAQAASPAAMPVPATVEASAEDITDIAAEGADDAADTVVDAVQDGANAVVDGASDAAEAVGDGAEKAVDAAGDLLEKAKDKAEEIADDVKAKDDEH